MAGYARTSSVLRLSRPPTHPVDGRGRLAYLARRAGAGSRGSAHWTHRRPRGQEVRRLAAIERRVRKAVRAQRRELRARRLRLVTVLAPASCRGIVNGVGGRLAG